MNLMMNTQRGKIRLSSSLVLLAAILVLVLGTQEASATEDINERVTWDIFSQVFYRGVDILTNKGRTREAQSVTPDGLDCLACAIGMVMVLDEVAREQQPVDQVLEHICTLLPSDLTALCEGAVSSISNETIEIIASAKSADDACTKLGYCENCHLDSPYDGDADEYYDYVYEPRKPTTLGFEGLKRVVRSTTVTDYYATEDSDGDLFSPTIDGTRDAYWRGRDCDDSNFNVRPGIYDDVSGLTDNNCNGIYGLEPTSNTPYEALFCNTTDSRSVVMFGDSAAAGLYIPPEWLSFENLTTLPEGFINQLDWPHHTWSTGWDTNETLDGVVPNSLYQRFRQQNLCNHRDYQSLTKNGADISWWITQMRALTLTYNSKPLMAFLAFIGDDVCRSKLSHMTLPQQFADLLTEGLVQFDQIAPAGTKLLTVGLINGSLSYDILWNQTHPLGVKYWQWYNFLTCTDTNPCQTWLSTNATMRNGATERAVELSAAMQQVVEAGQGTWRNIEVDYTPYPLEQGVQLANQLGYPTKSLIGPVDGFHPTPLAHNLFAEVLWDWLQENHADWVGPTNPNNDQIEQLFGDQGGY